MQVFPQALIAEIAARSIPEKLVLKAPDPGIDAGFMEFMDGAVMTGATDAVETEGLVSTDAVDGDLLKDSDGKTEGNARPDAVPTERQMAFGIEVVRERVGDGVSMAWSEKAQIVETGSPVRRDGPPGLSVATEHTTLPERIAGVFPGAATNEVPAVRASGAVVDRTIPEVPGRAEDFVPKPPPMIAKAGAVVAVDPGERPADRTAKPVEPGIRRGQPDITAPASRFVTGSAEAPVLAEGAGTATLAAVTMDDDAGPGRSSGPEGSVPAVTPEAGHPAARETALSSPKDTASPVHSAPTAQIPTIPIEQRGLRHGDETAPAGSPAPLVQRPDEAGSTASVAAHRPERDMPVPALPQVPDRTADADEDRLRRRDEVREPAFGRGVPDPVRPLTAGPPSAPGPLSGPLVAEAVAARIGEHGAHPLTHGAEVAAMQGREPAGPHAPDRTAGEPAAARSIVAQVVHSVSRAQADGVVEIRLQPEELGRVRLTMTPSEAGVSVQVTAERPETLELLRRHIDMLAADLGDRGFSNLDFSFGTGGSAREDAFDASDGVPSATEQAPSEGLQVDVSEQAAPAAEGTLDIRL